METIKIQWQANSSQWLCAALNSAQWQPLADWAENVADLTAVRLILSPVNYATHWVSLPGVSGRNLVRALPFALEESLIEDVADYLIVPAGQANKKNRAYAIAADLVERLLDECNMHHLQVRELIPATQLIAAGNQMLRSQQNGVSGWSISIPGVFEGWVPDFALTSVLESLFDDDSTSLTELTLSADSLDQAQLLKTTLETSFPGKTGNIECRVGDGQADAAQRLESKLTNLLTGRFQVKDDGRQQPAAWWRPLAALAAVWLVAATSWLFIEQLSTRKKADQVYTETLNLYKGLFPGERIRTPIERQIREKVSGDSGGAGDGFLGPLSVLAKVYAAQGLQKQVQMTSLKFNDRLHEITLEVQAASLNELQTLKTALENEGLTAEVASATNDKDGVKGRIRIGGAA